MGRRAGRWARERAGKEPWEGSGAAQSGMRASEKGLASFTNDKSD